MLGMLFVMKKYVAPDPVDIGPLGADAVVFAADDFANLIDQTWLGKVFSR